MAGKVECHRFGTGFRRKTFGVTIDSTVLEFFRHGAAGVGRTLR
jgi:hypothetical protein